MQCISRGELAPTVLQDLLAAFAQARGKTYTDQLTELSMRFFSGLVQISTGYSQELVEIVMPGFSTPAASPPQLDPADPTKWFQQLTDYAGSMSAKAVRAYQSLFERVAAGDTGLNQVQQASSTFLERRLPQHMRHMGRLYFDLLNGLNDLRVAYEEEFLSGVLATANGPEKETPLVLNMVAPLGGSTSASLSLANTRTEPARIRCGVTEVRRADGVGRAFAPKITFAPEPLELAPGEEASLMVSLQVNESDYNPGTPYVGLLYVMGHGEPRLEVPIRITATPAGPGSAQSRRARSEPQ